VQGGFPTPSWFGCRFDPKVLQISWGLRNKHFGILQSYEGYVVKRRLLVQPMAVLNRWCCYSLAAISGSASRLQRILRRQPMGDSPFLVLVAAAAAAAAVVVVVGKGVLGG